MRWLVILHLGLWTVAAAAAATLTLEPCPRDVGVPGAECGHLEVHEDREAGTGRQISLRVVVLPAVGRDVQPDPLFVLAGGPGMAASDMADLVSGTMHRIREKRAIVLVDQRGTGDSNGLDCEFVDADTMVYLPTDQALAPLRECLSSLDADLRLYTTPIAMDDLDQVRAALGYERINLWGGSYGTRAALVYLRRHGEHVRTVILDGLAPPAIRLPLHLGVDARRALDLVLDACAADADCGASFADLRTRLDDLLTRLEQTPEETVIQHPRTGEFTSVTITRDTVAFLVRAALYSAEMSTLLPLVIERASGGDYGPLAAMADPWIDIGQSMSIGMFFSVICSEDVPFVSESERQQLESEPFLGPTMLDLYSEVCGFWPRGDLPAGYGDPVLSDRPVLVLSGQLDPVTPPRWGEEVSRHLSDSRHLVVPGVGHGTLAYGCVPRLMAQFIDEGTTENLDVDCLQKLHRPPFFNSFTGPRAQGAP